MKLTKHILMMEQCSTKSTATDKSIKSKNIKTRVIPGYHLTFGIVVAMLSVIVLIPLASVLVYSLKISPAEFVGLILKENVRNAFITKMAENGIATNVHFKPLPMHTAYKELGFDIADYPNSYEMYHNEVTLPLHTNLTDEQVEYVIEQFNRLK